MAHQSPTPSPSLESSGKTRGVERPAALHEDELSPTKLRRDLATEGGQRIGDSTPVDGPDISPPPDREE